MASQWNGSDAHSIEIPLLFNSIGECPMSSMLLKMCIEPVSMRTLLCLLAGWMLIFPPQISASNADSVPDRQALINLTQNYFNAVGAKDIDSLRNYLLPEAQFIYRNGEEEDSTIGVTSVVRLLEILPGLKNELFERMQEPTVLVQGDIGIVWARYDFYKNKKFSHCGTDVFTFLKTKEGWKMANGSWSIEKKSCKAPPLGVPLK